jgi:hypothetical protein
MTIPIQTQHGSIPTTTILKAANIKTEGGSNTATILQRGGGQTIVGTPMLVSVNELVVIVENMHACIKLYNYDFDFINFMNTF